MTKNGKEFVNVKSLITAALEPTGFRRQGSRWYRWKEGILVELFWYKCSWDERYFLDVRVAVNDREISRSEEGVFYAFARLDRLVDSWQEVQNLSRKELSREDSKRFKEILEREAVPVLKQLLEPAGAKTLIPTLLPRNPTLRRWSYGEPIIREFERLISLKEVKTRQES